MIAEISFDTCDDVGISYRELTGEVLGGVEPRIASACRRARINDRVGRAERRERQGEASNQRLGGSVLCGA